MLPSSYKAFCQYYIGILILAHNYTPEKAAAECYKLVKPLWEKADKQKMEKFAEKVAGLKSVIK